LDLSGVISVVSKDKNLDKGIIIEALEQAVLHAARRDFGAEADLEATYNEETDEIDLFQFRTVVESVTDKSVEVDMKEALTLDPDPRWVIRLGLNLILQNSVELQLNRPSRSLCKKFARLKGTKSTRSTRIEKVKLCLAMSGVLKDVKLSST